MHRHAGGPGGLDLPWGVLVALLPLVPLAVLADRTVSLGSASLMVGWALVLVLQGTGGSGQYLIGEDAIGWTYTLAGLALLVGVVLRNSRLRQ